MSRPKGSKNRKKELQAIPEYAVALSVNGEKYSASGKDAEHALLALKMPKKFGTRAIFTLTHEGKTSKPVSLFVWQAKRLLAEGMSGQIQRSVLIKRLALLT